MKQKILIVDDEKPLRDTLARWFRPSYDCLVAPDADEAMKIVAANTMEPSAPRFVGRMPLAELAEA